MATPTLHPEIRPDWRNVGALSVALSAHTGLLLALFAPAAATDARRNAPEPPAMVYLEAQPLPPAPPPVPAPPKLSPRSPQAAVATPQPPAVVSPTVVSAVMSAPAPPTSTSPSTPPTDTMPAATATVSASASELPGYRNTHPVHYPQRAAARGLQGEVVLRVLVGVDGRPLRVELHRSSRHGVLDRAALQAVRQWRFRPEVRAGEAVAGWVLVPIAFSVRDV